MKMRTTLVLLLASSIAALNARRPIAISSKLPSTDSLPASSALLAAWNTALDDLQSQASEITEEALETWNLRSRIGGIPGTGITTREGRKATQEHLDCVSGEGEWVHEGNGAKAGVGLTVHKQESIYAACDTRFYKGKSHKNDEWDVRESLKWTWKPSSTCFTSLSSPRTTRTPLSRHRLCTLLSHKSTIMIGDTPQYSLHDLLLDWTTTKPQSCYGDRYCKEHSLCGEVLKSEMGEDQWRTDERVYNPLPASSKLGKRDFVESPVESRTKYSSPSYGTLLRFRRSDGLQPSSMFTVPNYVHRLTGVLEINQQWLADSRRSDLVIVTKSPPPLPSRTFSSYWSNWWKIVERGGETGAVMMLEGVVQLTREAWVPELVETLRQMRRDPSPIEQLIVYRGGWRSHSDCGAASLSSALQDEMDWGSPGDGPPPHRTQPPLLEIIFDNLSSPSTIPPAARLRNIHTVFTNLQTILQNLLARRHILPEFGIPFLDLESTLSVWRSGMIGGSASSPFSSTLHDQTNPNSLHGLHLGLRTSASGDCSRYCLPIPGMAIEETFIGGLITLLEMGWAGNEEMSKVWVGDGFANVREREEQ